MKILKRSLASLLVISLLMSSLLTVYADDALTDHNTDHSSQGHAQAGKYEWTYTAHKGGYKISLVMGKDGPLDTGESWYGGEAAILTGILSLNNPGDLQSSYITNVSAAWAQATPLYTDRDTVDSMMGKYDEDEQIASVEGPASISKLKQVSNIDRSMNTTGLFNHSKLVQDDGKIYQAVGLSSATDNNLQPTLVKKFPLSGEWTLTDEIFKVYATAFDDQDENSIYRALFDKLTSKMQTQVLQASGASSPEDVDTYKSFMNPASPDCIVGWACMIEPVYQLVYNGSDPLLLDDKYKTFLGTAMEWGNVWGASQATAIQAHDLFTNADSPDILDQIKEAYAQFATTDSTYLKYGMFRGVTSPLNHDMPTRIFNASGWFRSPRAAKGDGIYTPPDLLDAGAGVGIFMNTPKTPPEPQPCCFPAHDHGTVCPCGGAVRCHCPPGCTCDPNNYRDGCDCVAPPPPPPPPDPTIHEDHLSERLDKDMTSTNAPKTFTVTYKDEYQGGTRHYGDDSARHEEPGNCWYSCNGGCPGDVGPQHQHLASLAGLPGDHSVTEHCDPPTIWYDNWHIYEDYKYVWSNGQEFSSYIPSNNLTSYSKLVSASDPFKLLHDGDRAQIKWDGHINDTFKETDPNRTTDRGDLYEGTNHLTWISHRFAVSPSAQNAIWLSEYMTKYENSKLNDAYKNAMNATGFGGTLETTDGSKITESVKNTGGDFNWDIHVGNGESIKWASKEDAEYTFASTGTHEGGHYRTDNNPASCGGGSPANVDQQIIRDALATVTLNQANFSTNIHVQAVYPGSAVTQKLYDGDPYVKVSGDGNTWTFSSPSALFNFYPSYKIKAIYDVNGSDSDVWALSRRMRSFRAEDKLTINFSSKGGSIEAPWSRDHGDAANTAKAGSAYQYTGNGGTVSFDGYFHLLDPDFAPDPSKQAQTNKAIMDGYIKQLESVINGISGNNVGVYSNLYYAGTNSVYSPKIPGGFAGKNEGRETIKILNSSASGSIGGTSYNFLSGYDGVQTGSRAFGATPADPLGSNQWLTCNLERGGGIQISGWYDEDFEGIIVVHVTASIDVGKVDTAMTIIEENLSDSLTAVDANAQPISINVPGVGSFTKTRGAFAIGTEINVGGVSWGMASANVVGLFDPTVLHVRGNAYDMAD